MKIRPSVSLQQRFDSGQGLPGWLPTRPAILAKNVWIGVSQNSGMPGNLQLRDQRDASSNRVGFEHLKFIERNLLIPSLGK